MAQPTITSSATRAAITSLVVRDAGMMAFLWQIARQALQHDRPGRPLLGSQEGAPRRVVQPAARDRLSGPADLVYAPCERQTIWEGSHETTMPSGAVCRSRD